MQQSSAEGGGQGGALTPCPSCGASIEPVELCYYCCSSTSPKHRVKETTLMKYALIVMGLGVVLLVAAGMVDPHVTKISEMKVEDAFQHFRVEGEVTKTQMIRTPYKGSDIYNFWISDGTEASRHGLKVKVEGPIFYTLEQEKRVPVKGDLVSVEGTFHAGEGFQLLTVNTSSMLDILPAGAPTIAPDDKGGE